MNSLDKLNIKIFADGASFEDMINMNENSIIKGLTTNPSLMKKAGITNYEDFAKKVTREIKKKQFLSRYFLMILMKWKNKQKKFLLGEIMCMQKFLLQIRKKRAHVS